MNPVASMVDWRLRMNSYGRALHATNLVADVTERVRFEFDKAEATNRLRVPMDGRRANMGDVRSPLFAAYPALRCRMRLPRDQCSRCCGEFTQFKGQGAHD